MPETEAKGELALQTREMPVSSVDTEARTIDVVFTSGATVRRRRYRGWDTVIPYDEKLVVSDAAINMERMATRAAPVLDSHSAYSTYSQVGVVERAWVENGKGMATLRFPSKGTDAAADRLFALAAEGITRNISVGYSVDKVRVVEPETRDGVEQWIVERWTPYELSFVTIPADAGAQTRSGAAETYPVIIHRAIAQNQEGTMPENQTPAPGNAQTEENTRNAPVHIAPNPTPAAAELVAAERARASEITSIATRAGFSQEEMQTAIDTGVSVDAFRQQAFDKLAGTAEQTRTTAVHISRDEGDTARRDIGEALYARISGAAPAESARRYMDHSLVHMAASLMGTRGMFVTTASREDVLKRAFHVTSDFPAIFEGVINRVLASRYEVAQPVYRRIAKKRDFVDFRPHTQIRTGDFPMLKAIGEGGKIAFGTFGESKEQISVGSYAIQLAITRQMLVNDNLGAIDEVLSSYGDTVALFEEMTFFSQNFAGSGPVLMEDNKAVFHADHGNLAGAGTAINVAALSAARSAMRKQTNIAKNPINAMLKILLVSPDKETEAEQVTAAVQPVETGKVNPFSGKLEIVATPQLAGNAWYGFAEPSRIPVFQYGLLDGYTAPRLRLDTPFGVQGLGVSLEHDFGCGAIDFRGAYKNPGAAPA